MSSDPEHFKSDFPLASHEKWLELVEKTLRGKDYEQVMHKTSYDGIAIEALYTRDTAKIEPQANIDKAGWDIVQPYWGTDVAEANTALLRDLEGGAAAIAIRMAAGGFPGLPMCKESLAAVFDGIYLDLCSVHLLADEEFEHAGRAYLDLLDVRTVDSSAVRGSLGADPIGTLASTGRLLAPLDASVKSAAQLAGDCAGRYPGIAAFNVAGHIYHSAGASEAMELAACLSVGVHYLRAMEAEGMDMADAASQIEFSLAADADMFMTMAKFRSFRRLWAKVLSACGVETSATVVNAITAARMMSGRDPWVNILRNTTACLAAGIAGADSITILPHDTMLGLPSRFSRRIARNLQVILQEESYLSEVADPAAGSYAVETITAELTGKAWELFQHYEAAGGLAVKLRSGALAEELNAMWEKRKTSLDARLEPVTGVSEFPDIHERLPDVEAMPAFVEDVKPAGDSIQPITFHRNAEDFEALRSYSDVLLAKNGKRPSVYLVKIGTIAEHTARAMFAKNLFEAGGIEAVEGGASDIGVSFTASRADMAVLCGPDALYEREGEVTVMALKDAGCGQIYVAGSPDNSKALVGSGVDDFIFTGIDVLSILEDAMRKLGDGK